MSEQRSKISYLCPFIFALAIYSESSSSGEIKKNKVEEIKKERAILNEDGVNPSVNPKKNLVEEDSRPKKYKGKHSDDLFVGVENKNDKSDKELKVLIEGLSKLIKIEKPSTKRDELLLSKGAAHLNLAKYYRIKGKVPGKYKKEEEVNLKVAAELGKEVEKSTFSDNKIKARGLHLQGMTYTFLHNEEASIAAFTKALIVDKASPVNPRLSIYIAEYLYDKEKYFEALPKYSEYFGQLTQEEKALAIFKSGWCFLLTKQYSNAEKTFLKIIGKKWAGDFATDAIRDIAFSAVSHMKEQEVIDFGRANFGNKDKAILVDFYTEAYHVMIRESSNIDRPLLYNEILAVDSRPERKIVISLKRLNTHQRDYAADVPYQDMIAIKKAIIDNNFKPNDEGFKYFASELENEIKKLVKAYADTIFKKIKSSENIAEADLSKRLNTLLMMHIEWFQDSPLVTQSYVLALDNCVIIKDMECSLRLSRDILKKDALKNIWDRAQIQVVSCLESLSQKDPKYKDEYFTELLALVKSKEKNLLWVNLAKKLTVYYMENKKFEEASPLLDKIYNKEANSENLYRKLFCLYELKKYKEVAGYSKFLPKKDAPFYTELIGLFRESNIILAQDSAKGNDFGKYEEHLSEFLKFNSDDAKGDVAKADYFQRLADKEQFEKLQNGLQNLPPEKKYNEPYKKITQTLLMNLFKNGKSRDAFKFLAKDSKLGKYPDFNHYWFRALWVMQPLLNKKELEVLSQTNPKDRASIIGLLTLSRPEAVIQFYKTYPPTEDRDKRILLLSLQIKEGTKDVLLSGENFEMVQSILPPELLNTKITSSEKLVGYVEFPDASWPEKKLAKIMPDAVSRIRTIRAQVLRDVVGKSYLVQKRILNTALISETKMVDFFKAAPVPKNLAPEQEKAYKDELASVSTEFADQASEYEKMIVNIDLKLAEIKKDEMTIPKDLKDWPKPATEVSKLVDAELAVKNGFAALLILEGQRAYEKISDEDYYSLRAYSILKSIPNPVTAKYIQDELVTAKQTALIEKWKALSSPSEDAKRGVASEKKVIKKKGGNNE